MATRVVEVEVRTLADEPSSGNAYLAIETAHIVTDQQLLTPNKITDEEMLRQIEMYLAAHFLKSMASARGPLAGETFGDSSERYHNIFAAGLGSTIFGQHAMAIDYTGTLSRWSERSTGKKTALIRVVGDPTGTDYKIWPTP
jgi:hypothetical protein